ncbi:MAG: hypothetical protein AAF456_20760 [Planctomycetota bacterium]
MSSMILKGVAWPSGHVEFSRKENDWAFSRIKDGMTEGQKNSIRVNPSVATFEIAAAHQDAEDSDVPWMESLDRLLKTADRVYLEFHGDYLRFRRSVHELNKHRRFITLGSQAAVNDFFQRSLGMVKYFYAHRSDPTFFEVESAVDFGRKSKSAETRPIELPARMKVVEDSPVIVFSASGANAPMEIVEWRSNVKVGDRGRFNRDGSHVALAINQVSRPWTIYREFRDEFNNNSYTFTPDKFQGKLDKLVEKRLKELESRSESE